MVIQGKHCPHGGGGAGDRSDGVGCVFKKNAVANHPHLRRFVENLCKRLISRPVIPFLPSFMDVFDEFDEFDGDV